MHAAAIVEIFAAENIDLARKHATGIAAATRARLVGVSVGELAQALRFSGLSIFTGRDGAVEVRRVDSNTKEIQR